MLPKPTFCPKSKRLPARKRMTVVIGLKFGENILLAADREENDSYLRYQVQKIKRFGFPGGMMVGVTGDGDAHFIDYSTEKLINHFVTHPRLNASRMSEVVEKVLKGVFDQHIFPGTYPDGTRRDFGLLVGVSQNGKAKLFKTEQAAPVEVLDFAASGSGCSYAHILLERLWGTLTLQSAFLLALHVVQQTKKHVSKVGGGTDIAIFKSDGKTATVTSTLTKGLEEKLEKLDYAFDGAFFSALWGGDWMRDANNFRDRVKKIRMELDADLDRLFADFKL